jgi:predicted nucleic acid-binding protein
VDLVLLGGDNIYPSGNLALVETTFRRPYRELLAAGVPFHAVLGNHDIRTANGAPQVAYRPFGMAGHWYALRRGDVAFFLLDTNVISEPQRREPNARVLEWIDAQALETLYLSAITVAELLAKSRAVGLAVETADAFIAAVALANGFAVATRDTRPFEAAGVNVINPWE